MPLVPFVNRGLTFPIEGQDVVRLRVWPFHSGRADRHSRNSQPHNIRFFSKQTGDRVGVYVSLDYVAVDDTRMASSELSWHVVLRFDLEQLGVANVLRVNLETILL